METWTTEQFDQWLREGGKGRKKQANATTWRPAGTTTTKKRRSSRTEEEKQYENKLHDQLVAAGFRVIREHKFHTKRRWKIDLYLPDYKIAIEIEGGIWNGGRHTRGYGYKGDVEKYNEVVLAGLHLLRFVTDHVKRDEAMPVILRAIEQIEKAERQKERRKHER